MWVARSSVTSHRSFDRFLRETLLPFEWSRIPAGVHTGFPGFLTRAFHSSVTDHLVMSLHVVDAPVKSRALDPTSYENLEPMAQKTPVSISPWINERYPPLHELLSAHDVARLIRRPRWAIAGLRLIRRFPKSLKFRGRPIGWRRSDVMNWMARSAALTSTKLPKAITRDRRPRNCPQQACLPLKFLRHRTSTDRRSSVRRHKSARPRGNRK